MKSWSGKKYHSPIEVRTNRTSIPPYLILRSTCVLFIFILFVGHACALSEPHKACPLPTPLCEGLSCDVARSQDAWHGVAQCLRYIRDLWSRNGPGFVVTGEGKERATPVWFFARNVVANEMRVKSVRFTVTSGLNSESLSFSEVYRPDFELLQPFNFIALHNDIGQPYNAMGQTGIAYFLYHLASLSKRGGYPGSDRDSVFYRTLAEGAIKAVLTPVEDGGLMSNAPCVTTSSRCAWFHSITRRDKTTREGATLNQNLHAIRDMGMINDLLAKHGWDEELRRDLERAISEGINQLLDNKKRYASGELPTLLDFFSPPVGKEHVQWVYYGFNPTSNPPKGGYFLARNGKDCHYQIHNLQLLAQILDRAERTGVRINHSANTACSSPVAKMYRNTKLRLTHPISTGSAPAATSNSSICGLVKFPQ